MACTLCDVNGQLFDQLAMIAAFPSAATAVWDYSVLHKRMSRHG
jgi:hypothetical protein